MKKDILIIHFTKPDLLNNSIINSHKNKNGMKRTAKAHWSGTLKEGKGTLTTQSGILNGTNFSFQTRFEEDKKGTNPEELLAAAHAGCFTMAVDSHLTKNGFNPTFLDTEATITMEGTTITGVHLSITGSVPGISASDFETITKEAEKNCVISRALSIPISSEAHFVV
jgi:lipoyl-dependent peroxiredoxin